MFEVSVQTTISASHRLRGHQGKCEKLHGHNWRIEATAGREELDGLGMVVDFSIFRQMLKEATASFDHTDLNGLPEFERVNPSSENLARIVYERLRPRLARGGVRLLRVTVWETEGSAAVYHEEE
ncbi:MAG: 6-carboxytetrahydropterin synthase [Myxococcales bacterium]|nr:6-carboxytetrahydropterin synthase [Myxococcales bacterium]